jgi:hypothetical protein
LQPETIEQKKTKNKRTKRKIKPEPESKKTPAPATWCGELITPSSHHYLLVVYILKEQFGLEREK